MRPSSCLPWQHEPTGPTRRIPRWPAQGSYTTPRDTIDKSDTERSQARSLSQRLLAHSREALALETWAGDQPGRKIQDSDKFENWRKDADALLDEYRQMSRNRSMAPHINDREEARTFFDRRIAYISEERFAALPKPDPTQQKALQAQQTQEAQQDQGMTMSL